MEENEDLIGNIIKYCLEKMASKIPDENFYSSKEFTEIVRNSISLSKNKDQINESLLRKKANNEFIENLKVRINDEIDHNPELFEELSALLTKLGNHIDNDEC